MTFSKLNVFNLTIYDLKFNYLQLLQSKYMHAFLYFIFCRVYFILNDKQNICETVNIVCFLFDIFKFVISIACVVNNLCK